MFRVKSPQDFGAAILFLAIGIAGIYFGRDLAFGTASRMGPGYFPTMLSGIIVLIGAIVGLQSLVVEGPPIEPIRLRPILFILVVHSGVRLPDRADRARDHDRGLDDFCGLRAARREPERNRRAGGLSVRRSRSRVFVYALGQPLPVWWGR